MAAGRLSYLVAGAPGSSAGAERVRTTLRVTGWQTVRVQKEEAEQVVAALRARSVFAHVQHMSVSRVGIRVVLPTGAEAIWDGDGAAGLDAQVLRDGVLVGFVPVIAGSADFGIEQTVEAIASAEYGTT